MPLQHFYSLSFGSWYHWISNIKGKSSLHVKLEYFWCVLVDLLVVWYLLLIMRIIMSVLVVSLVEWLDLCFCLSLWSVWRFVRHLDIRGVIPKQRKLFCKFDITYWFLFVVNFTIYCHAHIIIHWSNQVFKAYYLYLYSGNPGGIVEVDGRSIHSDELAPDAVGVGSLEISVIEHENTLPSYENVIQDSQLPPRYNEIQD